MVKNYHKIEEEALAWLEDKVNEGRLVFKRSELSSSIYKFLENRGNAVDLHGPYFFLKLEHEHPLHAFQNHYWKILIQFMNLRFPSKDYNPAWYLTGTHPYNFLVDRVMLPNNKEQVSLSSKANSNTVITLFENYSLTISTDKDFESKTIVKKEIVPGDDIQILKPEHTIIQSSQTQYALYEENIVSFLKQSSFDFNFVEQYFKSNRSPVLMARFIGALEQINNPIQAMYFKELFKTYEFKNAIENPFAKEYELQTRSKPAYVTRFILSMQKAKKFLDEFKVPRRKSKKVEARDIDELTVDETYHSLTIEGYDVTRELIESIQKDLDNANKDYSQLRNHAAAAGFMRSLKLIKSLLKNKIEITEDLTTQLWQELWPPSLNAGLLKHQSDIYRTHLVSIRGSQFIPPNHEKIHYLLDAFYDMANDFDNGFSQGIFLHYFYVWIHPHSDGNGRISRFLLNLAMIEDKYSWITINSKDRNQYFKALERSNVEDDISYFAEFIRSIS